MARSTTIALTLLLAAIAASACGDDRPSTPGGPGNRRDPPRDSGVPAERTDGGGERGPDSGFPGLDGGLPDFGPFQLPDASPRHDAGLIGRDAFEGWPDATEWPDAQEWRPDAFEGWPDAAEWHPDARPVFADAAPRDTGLWFLDAGHGGDAGTDDAGPPVQTHVTMSLADTHVVVDLRPGAPADPISFRTVLSYSNAGPTDETISVTAARIDQIVFVTQTFQVGPDHLAPVGDSTEMVAKIPGTGSAVSVSSLFCMIPIVNLRLELSNGLVLANIVTLECMQ